MIPFPRIETPDRKILLASNRPLEEGVKRAILWMMEWIVQEFKMDVKEAYVRMLSL